MNKKFLRNLSGFASALDLSLDSQSATIFGAHNGYSVCLTPTNETYNFTLSVAVNKNNHLPDVKELKALVSATKALTSCNVQGYRVNYTVRAGMTASKTEKRLQEALEAVTSFLRQKSFNNCCLGCGKDENTQVYSISGVANPMCESCFTDRCEKAAVNAFQETQKKENVISGTVGAILGSLLGVAAIVLLGQLGYVAALSGVALAVCTLKGYELLAGRLTKRGVVLSIIIMLIMVYVGNRLDWAISVARYFEGFSVLESFRYIPEMVREGYFEDNSYYVNLAMAYAFALVGAVPAIKNFLRSKDIANTNYKMHAAGNLMQE